MNRSCVRLLKWHLMMIVLCTVFSRHRTMQQNLRPELPIIQPQSHLHSAISIVYIRQHSSGRYKISSVVLWIQVGTNLAGDGGKIGQPIGISLSNSAIKRRLYECKYRGFISRCKPLVTLKNTSFYRSDWKAADWLPDFPESTWPKFKAPH